VARYSREEGIIEEFPYPAWVIRELIDADERCIRPLQSSLMLLKLAAEYRGLFQRTEFVCSEGSVSNRPTSGPANLSTIPAG